MAQGTGSRRHLLDPEQVRRDYERLQQSTPGGAPARSSGMSLGQVQRWVISVAAASTLLHLSGGLILAAVYVEPDRLDAQIGLNVIAAAFGVLSVAVFKMIHLRSPWTWWLLLGLLPGVLGLWITLR